MEDRSAPLALSGTSSPLVSWCNKGGGGGGGTDDGLCMWGMGGGGGGIFNGSEGIFWVLEESSLPERNKEIKNYWSK